MMKKITSVWNLKSNCSSGQLLDQKCTIQAPTQVVENMNILAFYTNVEM